MLWYAWIFHVGNFSEDTKAHILQTIEIYSVKETGNIEDEMLTVVVHMAYIVMLSR